MNFLLSSIDVEITLSQEIYSSGLWNAFTTSWFKIYSIFSLFVGLNTIIFSKKSMKGGEKSLRKLIGFELVDILISLIMDLDTYD